LKKLCERHRESLAQNVEEPVIGRRKPFHLKTLLHATPQAAQ
jgi:hypothetical protein